MKTITNLVLGTLPGNRFEITRYYDADGSAKSRTMATRDGAFLDDIWTFDNAFFNITPREAKSMDPQQRILLHTAQSALDDAGYIPDATLTFQRKTMGCYIGVATGDYTDNLRDDIDVFYSPVSSGMWFATRTWRLTTNPGTLRAFHSGRLSFVHKFSGPSIVTDTACSSSLVSVYQACRAIQNGDCAAALAGGVNAICSPDVIKVPASWKRRLMFSRCTWVYLVAIFLVPLAVVNPLTLPRTDTVEPRAAVSLS